MLMEYSHPPTSGEQVDQLIQLMLALASRARDTDVVGWYRENVTVGALFTEVSAQDRHSALSAVLNKFGELRGTEQRVIEFSQLCVSFHFFPDDWKEGDPIGGSSDPALYPDLLAAAKARRVAQGIKRTMDISLSLLLLVLCLPAFLVIALAIKLTSKGPVFYRQQRVGQYGRQFTFLKFRSMRANNDCTAHRDYVRQLIAGQALRVATNNDIVGVYKLANDNRVTLVGRVLRRTSLDELPQLLNVLHGEMSLVGPRPPIPYELGSYQAWHRRRLMQVKPGITGLWQVKGRSRVKFDDMVRLDIKYAETWSLWNDLKILLQTPAAVLRGAY